MVLEELVTGNYNLMKRIPNIRLTDEKLLFDCALKRIKRLYT